MPALGTAQGCCKDQSIYSVQKTLEDKDHGIILGPGSEWNESKTIALRIKCEFQ